jgi:hypothetical protein
MRTGLCGEHRRDSRHLLTMKIRVELPQVRLSKRASFTFLGVFFSFDRSVSPTREATAPTNVCEQW